MPYRTLVALILACGLLWAPVASSQAIYEGVGTEAPDASLSDLNGGRHRLHEGPAAWALLKFGTTWCAGCAQEVRELNKLADDLQSLGVRVVEVFVRETPAVVRADLKAQPRAYRAAFLLDEKGDTVALYGLSVIPRLLLVDPQGVVRVDTHYTGAPRLKQTLQKAIQGR